MSIKAEHALDPPHIGMPHSTTQDDHHRHFGRVTMSIFLHMHLELASERPPVYLMIRNADAAEIKE